MSVLELTSIFAMPLRDGGLESLVEQASEHRAVLIGEMSHGTEEFYAVRAQLTRQLLQRWEHELPAASTVCLLLEANYADMSAVNDFVSGRSAEPPVLGREFPQWMWHNAVTLDFFQYLRSRAATSPLKVQVLGFDLYGLRRSAQRVLEGLTSMPELRARAERVYAPFLQLGERESEYGSSGRNLSVECNEIVEALTDAGLYGSELYENACVVRDAEEYYRTTDGAESWNVRDRHMFSVAERRIVAGASRLVVWAHNSHVLDFRATSHAERGEHSVGQLIREALSNDGTKGTFIIGQSSYDGTVRAAPSWGQPSQVMEVVRPASSSLQAVLHQAHATNGAPADFVLVFGDTNPELTRAFYAQMPMRAIGVVYKPQDENLSHYFDACVSYCCDALIHMDTTSALRV